MLVSALASLVFASTALAQAQYLAPDLSFGHNGKVSPNGRAIPNFHLIGEPEILSNKIVLTPVAPGNQRGAIWAEKPLEFSQWTADVEFRASGPERGGGNLQIWIAKDGEKEIGTASIYTVGKFEGFGLIIDQYSGSAGMVRGFLNDGSVQFSTHHSVDSLAFGHCGRGYRNLGRPMQLKIRHDSDILRVDIDGQTCFESPHVRIPPGYSFGLTAASAETPDSFEVFKMVITTDTTGSGDSNPPPPPPQQELERSVDDEYKTAGSATDNNLRDGEDVPLVPASSIEVSQQFTDLHNRMQSLSKHMTGIQRDLKHYKSDASTRHREVRDAMVDVRDSTKRLDTMQTQLDGLARTLAGVEQTLRELKDAPRTASSGGDSDLKRHFDDLKRAVRDSQSSVLQGMPKLVDASGPSFFVMLLAFVGVQLALLSAYVYYKKRRAEMPKKFV